ncbi:hypothetical protein [Leifsonia sp. fls2-241-R2A-40a]|uniref:hypothetical protein n=1 Tax=Leifsonia sp. fls2-241-R2A-40a TaxID=3040290 RepID=UPI00254ABA07|nr:hypothetical protein [Leifsonia sp. fls2-241-R2A-40a]
MTPSEGVFNENEISRVIGILNEVSRETSLLLVPLQLRKAAENAGIDLSDAILRAIEEALSYELVSDESKLFNTTFRSDNGGWPPPYAEADLPTRQLWSDLASKLKPADLVARFSDLLLSSATRTGVDGAQQTVNAYMDAVRLAIESHEAGPYLLRALTIARTYRLAAEEQRVRHAAYQISGKAFSGDISLNLLRYSIAALVLPPSQAHHRVMRRSKGWSTPHCGCLEPPGRFSSLMQWSNALPSLQGRPTFHPSGVFKSKRT